MPSCSSLPATLSIYHASLSSTHSRIASSATLVIASWSYLRDRPRGSVSMTLPPANAAAAAPFISAAPDASVGLVLRRLGVFFFLARAIDDHSMADGSGRSGRLKRPGWPPQR